MCSSIDWLKSDRRHPGELDFPHLKMIGMVESETTRGPEPVRERRYYLCSKVMTAERFAEVVRAHWGVENSLHWCPDVTFDDDQCRLRTGHGPQNMAMARHIAMNLLRATKTKSSREVRRKKAAWSPEYLEDILRGEG